MEFGPRDILDMVEGRFGHKCTVAIQCLIALAIISFCLHMVFSDLCLPIYHGVLLFRNDKSLSDLLKDKGVSILISILITAGFVLAILLVALSTLQWRYRTLTNRLENVISRAEEYSRGVDARVEAVLALATEQEEISREAKSVLQEVKALLLNAET
jgi:predicted PurR-regulated permease PerM